MVTKHSVLSFADGFIEQIQCSVDFCQLVRLEYFPECDGSFNESVLESAVWMFASKNVWLRTKRSGVRIPPGTR